MTSKAFDYIFMFLGFLSLGVCWNDCHRQGSGGSGAVEQTKKFSNSVINLILRYGCIILRFF